MTIMDAIHEKILDETKRLLTETDIPVAAIAEEMGFNNPSGLYALFKRKTGSTMSEFRKNRPLLYAKRRKTQGDAASLLRQSSCQKNLSASHEKNVSGAMPCPPIR
jgi:AraC-like DNA-binding protein